MSEGSDNDYNAYAFEKKQKQKQNKAKKAYMSEKGEAPGRSKCTSFRNVVYIQSSHQKKISPPLQNEDLRLLLNPVRHFLICITLKVQKWWSVEAACV